MKHNKSSRKDQKRKNKKKKCSYTTLYCKKKMPLKENQKKLDDFPIVVKEVKVKRKPLRKMRGMTKHLTINL